MIRATMTGDWAKVNAIIQNLNTNLKVGAIQKLKEDAETVQDALLEEIWSDASKPMISRNWDKSSPYWWVDRGILIDSIKPLASSAGAGYGIFIGFEGDHPDSDGWSNADLAEHLEQSHPKVKPAWEKVGDKILKSWDDYIMSLIHGGVSI